MEFSYNPIPDIMIATKLCISYGSWTVVACAVFQRPRTWWCHQMETFSALLALSARGLPVKFPSQRPVTRSFDVFLDLRPNKGMSKQSWGWWFETPSRALRRCCNVITIDNLLAKTVSGVAKLINRYIFCMWERKNMKSKTMITYIVTKIITYSDTHTYRYTHTPIRMHYQKQISSQRAALEVVS